MSTNEYLSGRRSRLTSPVVKWLGGVVSVGVVVAIVVFIVGVDGFGGDDAVSPVHVEEFRVAEPLTTETEITSESALQARLETITAVTEPFDDVEAAVDEEPKPLAESRSELEKQCVTILKEMAFCTNEDSFLDLIGTAPNLRASEDRQRFMERVHHWFEPGGTAGDCRELLDEQEKLHELDARTMWQRAATGTELLCDDFGQVLLDADTFRWIGVIWEE